MAANPRPQPHAGARVPDNQDNTDDDDVDCWPAATLDGVWVWEDQYANTFCCTRTTSVTDIVRPLVQNPRNPNQVLRLASTYVRSTVVSEEEGLYERCPVAGPPTLYEQDQKGLDRMVDPEAALGWIRHLGLGVRLVVPDPTEGIPETRTAPETCTTAVVHARM